MFCSKCGNEIAEGAAFCPKCGTKVVNVGDGQQPMDISVTDSVDQQTSETVEDTQQTRSDNAAKVNGNLRKIANVGRVLMWGSLVCLMLLPIPPIVPVAGVAIGIILSALGTKPLGLSKIIELAVAVILLVVIAVSAMS